jgi:hypothetical protein
MNGRVERGFHLGGGAAEYDRQVSRGDFVHFEAVGLQPFRHLFGVPFRHAKVLAKFLRRHPLMIVRRLGIVLGVEQLRECLNLGGVGLQRQHHTVHAIFGIDRAGVGSRSGQRMAIAVQSDAPIIVDESRDAVAGLGQGRTLRHGWQPGNRHSQ